MVFVWKHVPQIPFLILLSINVINALQIVQVALTLSIIVVVVLKTIVDFGTLVVLQVNVCRIVQLDITLMVQIASYVMKVVYFVNKSTIVLSVK